MGDADDRDLLILRGTKRNIDTLRTRSSLLLSQLSENDQSNERSNRIQDKLTGAVAQLLDFFQEDPQLLDPYLKDLVPSFATQFLDLIDRDLEKPLSSSLFNTPARCITSVLYAFCKVRGDKVISRFLGNEARYVEPMLHAYETHANGASVHWEQRYVMLLWLGHLILTPFDLRHVATGFGSGTLNLPLTLSANKNLPPVALRALNIGLGALASPTRIQKPASQLLVRLALRPDLREHGLLDSLVQWTLTNLKSSADEVESTHICMGLLLFVSGLITSANINDISQHLQTIEQTVTSIFDSGMGNLPMLAQSALAKRMAIKIRRNIAVQLLRIRSNPNAKAYATYQLLIVDSGLLEDVIDFLLRSLADRETQVRYAASKALSLVTLSLDSDMANQVVEAVIDSMNVDVFMDKGRKSLAVANASRWHGLTLTLSHMLFRRSPTPDQLPAVLNALYLALQFEQRSATGSSIGANVRDAANFGLWSLSRRYRTAELQAVPSAELTSTSSAADNLSAIEHTAVNLLTCACLDPVGNIRRGSSAALQELIGRHPDKVERGIDLIQIVDYHAVGLRRRAMQEVVWAAAALSPSYHKALFAVLLTWRGSKAPDEESRRQAATSIGVLGVSAKTNTSSILQMYSKEVADLDSTESLARHGLCLALAAIISAASKQEDLPQLQLTEFTTQWKLFERELLVDERMVSTDANRPELVVEATLRLQQALASCCIAVGRAPDVAKATKPSAGAIQSLTICVRRCPESLLSLAAQTMSDVCSICSQNTLEELASSFIHTIKQHTLPGRLHGPITALGVLLQPSRESCPVITNQIRNTALDILLQRVSEKHDMNVRVVALRSLSAVLDHADATKSDTARATLNLVLEAIGNALNDYTINERGDVGSLLRIEALNIISEHWKIFEDEKLPYAGSCTWSVYRLALEKLDNVRLQAARALKQHEDVVVERLPDSSKMTLADVSDYKYFARFGSLLGQDRQKSQSQEARQSQLQAIIVGLCLTAGAGNDPVLSAAREALHHSLCRLDVDIEFDTPGPDITLNEVGAVLIQLLSSNLGNERVLVPLLESLSFVLEANVLQRLDRSNFKWRTLLSLVQKAHFKSTNMAKLLAAVMVYHGLLDVSSIRLEVEKKLISMLSHPFPKIRVAAAEVLFAATAEDRLKGRDWSGPSPPNKSLVADLARAVQQQS